MEKLSYLLVGESMGKIGLGWGREGVQSLAPGILSLIELIKPAVMKLWKQFNVHV